MPEIDIKPNKPRLFVRILLGFLVVITLPITFITFLMLYFALPKDFKRLINFFMPNTFSKETLDIKSNEKKASNGLIKSSYSGIGKAFESTGFSHNILIKCAQKLGYPADDEGVCRGFTMRWVEAVLTNTTEQFLTRTKKIVELYKVLNKGIGVESLEQSHGFSKDELWDIKAFYESLLLYQTPELSAEVLNELVIQNDIEKISQVASSEAMIEAGGLKKTEAFYYGKFKEKDVKSFLTKLQIEIIKSGYQNTVPFLFTLMKANGGLHSVCLTFNPNDKTWEFMDVYSFPPKQASSIEALLLKLPLKEYQFFSLRAILPNIQVDNIDNLVSKICSITLDAKSFLNLNKFYPIFVRDGNLEVIRLLLENGADPNEVMINGATPLHCAARDSKIDVLELLLKNKAKPNQVSVNGETSLFFAAQNGHVAVVKKLLENGAQPNLALESGATSLYVAARNGKIDVVELLLKNSADPNQAMRNGETPLFIAAKNDNLAVVKLLLASRANPNQKKINGETPLFVAAENGHVAVVKELLAHGVDPNQSFADGATPLFIAAQNDRIDVVLLLLENQANPNLAIINDATPLMIAAEKGHVAVLEALLAHGADPNQALRDGSTPLFNAAHMGNLDVVQALLAQKGINLNQTSNCGASPLLIAAEHGRVSVVEALLVHGADSNIALPNGATPLFFAAQNGHVEVVEALLKNQKVDINIPLQSTQELLEKFANNQIPQDDNIVRRMAEHIAHFKETHPDSTIIEITPREIAMIMGHESVLETFLNIEHNSERRFGI